MPAEAETGLRRAGCMTCDPSTISRAAARKLDVLQAAVKLSDLRIPSGNRLEALKGDLKGYHSIRINEQWRIVFRWSDGDAYDVRVEDYH